MKTPLYFNYSGSRRDLMDRAIESFEKHAGHLIEIRVNYSPKPRPFTVCLNEILRSASNTNKFFFAHYDAELESAEPVESMLADKSNSALLCWTTITDLLMLVDVKQINEVGGWDESFKNSYMELDLNIRLGAVNKPIKTLNAFEAGGGLIHNEASQMRNPHLPDNLAKVYSESFLKDALTFYTKHGAGEKDPEYIKMIEHDRLHFPEKYKQ